MPSLTLLPPCACQNNVPLSLYSTFGIGGPARWLVHIHRKEEAAQLLRWAYETGTRYVVIGKGSNVLFDDQGFPGLVLINRLHFLERQGDQFHVGSGMSFPRLGKLAAQQGLSGLEFAIGIPATVGGAIYMNAGASGQETYDTIVEVTYLSPDGVETIVDKTHLIAAYRTSPFQHRGGMIVSGTFALQPAEGVYQKQKTLLDYRIRTQPYGMKSIGCIFRNPSETSAGRLIEESGLKGLRQGGVCVSDRHANFIIHDTEQGSAQDVLQLIHKIKERVQELHGIILHEEIQYIPYDISC